MGVIRESEWIDSEDMNEAQVMFLAIVMDDAMEGRSVCVLCRAEQPSDMRWPAYAMEVEKRSTGENSGDIQYRACPDCEQRVDEFIFRVGHR